MLFKRIFRQNGEKCETNKQTNKQTKKADKTKTVIPGRVLRISSVGDDRMGAKIKNPKIPRAFKKKLTPKKAPCRISEP